MNLNETLEKAMKTAKLGIQKKQSAISDLQKDAAKIAKKGNGEESKAKLDAIRKEAATLQRQQQAYSLVANRAGFMQKAFNAYANVKLLSAISKLPNALERGGTAALIPTHSLDWFDGTVEASGHTKEEYESLMARDSWEPWMEYFREDMQECNKALEKVKLDPLFDEEDLAKTNAKDPKTIDDLKELGIQQEPQNAIIYEIER